MIPIFTKIYSWKTNTVPLQPKVRSSWKKIIQKKPKCIGINHILIYKKLVKFIRRCIIIFSMTSSHFLNPDRNKKISLKYKIGNRLWHVRTDEIRSGFPKILISAVKVLSFSINSIFLYRNLDQSKILKKIFWKNLEPSPQRSVHKDI